MESKIFAECCHQVQHVCVTHESRPLRRLTSATKRRSYDYSLFVILFLMILAQIPQRSAAAALPQQISDDSESLESAEDTFNLLHELARFIHQEHKAGEFGDERERRVYKRHNAERAIDTHNNEPAWQNVCGHDSAWSGDELAEDLSQDYIKLYMKNLRQAIRLEYKNLKSHGIHDIDIDDMRAWRRHERKYKFLPTLEHNVTIAPVCWHQSLQKFIASFDYLRKVQQQWDQQHLHTHSSITRNLQELLQSAKRVLCEIETSINGCFPRTQRQVASIPRDAIFAQMNFYTKSRNAAANDATSQRGVNHIDLRFAKFFYQNYLLRIWKTLPRHAKQIQMVYTCDTNTYPNILDRSLEKDASILNSYDDDSSAE